MSKLKLFIATILLIPSLAFAANQCDKYTDQDFRDMLTVGPSTLPWSLEAMGIIGTLTIDYHEDGMLDEHFNFTIHETKATMDLKANWDISNAVLYFHLISIKHSSTHNKKLNKDLDNLVNKIKGTPDSEIPVQALGLCSGKRSNHAVIPFASLLN